MKAKYPGLAARSSRRSVIKRAAIGVGGLAVTTGVVGAGIAISQQSSNGAHAAGYAATPTPQTTDTIQTILNVAVTAELLAVTFYNRVFTNRFKLGLGEAARFDILAALIEEQIHANFLLKQGAKPLTKVFSFPFGEDTFERFDRFITVQQQLEALFVAAYIAAGREFAMLQRPDLVQIAAQIGSVEAEHRVIGRAIGGLRPANNHAFSPAFVKMVSDAVNILKQAGFLTPKAGNSFTYQAVSTDDYNGVVALLP
jgi:hypothetical protein